MADQLKIVSYALSALYTVALGYTLFFSSHMNNPKSSPVLSWLHQDTISSVPHFSGLMLLAWGVAPTPTFVYIGTVYGLYLAICAVMGLKGLITISAVVFGFVWLTRIRPPSDDEIWPHMANAQNFQSERTKTSTAPSSRPTNGEAAAPTQDVSISTPPRPSMKLNTVQATDELHKDFEEVMNRYSALVDETESRSRFSSRPSPSMLSSPLSSANSSIANSSISRRATPIFIGPGMSSLGSRNKQSKPRQPIPPGSFIDPNSSFLSHSSFASTTSTEPDSEGDPGPGNGLMLDTAALMGIAAK